MVSKTKLAENISSLISLNTYDIFNYIRHTKSLPTLKSICEECKLNVRALSKGKNSDNFSKTLLSIGVKKDIISILNPMGRSKFLLDHGYTKLMLMKLAYKKNKKPCELTQRDLKSDPLLSTLLPSDILKTSTLLLESGAVSSLKELKNWPKNWPSMEEAQSLYLYLHNKFVVNNKWASVRKLRSDTIGVKFMDKFNRNVKEMSKFFTDSILDTNTAPNGFLKSQENIALLIENGVKKMGLKLIDLPTIKQKDLMQSTQYGSSIPSALSKYFKQDYPAFCCKIFPEIKAEPWHFINGVANHYWFEDTKAGEDRTLDYKKTRKAILELIAKIFPNSIPIKKTLEELLPLLTQQDFIKLKLSYLASMPKIGKPDLIQSSFPELKIKLPIQNSHRNSIRLTKLLVNYSYKPNLDTSNYTEKPYCTGQSGTNPLVIDVKMPFLLNGIKRSVSWEIQGSQHIDSKHKFHKKRQNSFQKQVKNDFIKFNRHQSENGIIIYLKPNQLSINDILTEAKQQGLDIKHGVWLRPLAEGLKEYLIKNGLLAAEAFD